MCVCVKWRKGGVVREKEKVCQECVCSCVCVCVCVQWREGVVGSPPVLHTVVEKVFSRRVVEKVFSTRVF